MGATADNIWSVPAYLPFLQPPLTDAVVAAAEEKIGHRLPSEYIELLRKQNGGYIRYALPESVHHLIAGIGPNFPSLTEFDLSEHQAEVAFPLEGLVPFDGDGHWYLCLDYRADSAAPAVTYVDIECDSQTPVAASFNDYLAQLMIDDRDQIVLEGVTNIEDVIGRLGTVLGAAFEAPEQRAFGYPVHRANLGQKTDPDWVWISPNLVPRGHVGMGEPVDAELKDLWTGTATRYEELPADSFLVGASDRVRPKVIEACKRLQLRFRPMRDYL